MALWHRASRKAKIALGTILAAMAVGGILLRSEPEKLPQPMPSPEIERDVREVAENQGLWSEPASDIGVREALASYDRESPAKDGQTATDPKLSESQRQDEEKAISEVDDLIEPESQPSAEGEIETASSSDADESMETPLSETTEEPAVQQFLSAAEAALADYRLTTPDDHSASFYYRQVLELVPDHPEARRGLVQIADRYASLARKEIGRGQFQRARRYIRRGLSVQPAHSGLLALKVRSSRSSKPSKPSRPTSSDPGGYFLENF